MPIYQARNISSSEDRNLSQSRVVAGRREAFLANRAPALPRRWAPWPITSRRAVARDGPPRQSGRWAPGGNQWALPWGFEAPRPHKATTTKGKKGVGRVLVFLNDIFPPDGQYPLLIVIFVCIYLLLRMY